MGVRDRSGFTLVELIIVTVLGALVIGATLQVLITNQRTYTAQNATVQGQQASRMALDVLMSELREVSARGGDLLGMGTDSVRVRRMRKFGVTCQVYVGGSSDNHYVLRIGDAFEQDDSVFVFADNVESQSSDDVWVSARITAVDTTVACPDGSRGVQIRFGGQQSLFDQLLNANADSVRVGAPVRNFEYYTYGTTTYLGETYLARREGSEDFVPIAGPLRSSGGLQFAYRDSIGNVTNVATDVRQIVVKVRTGSEVLNSRGQMVSDSITAWIYTRN